MHHLETIRVINHVVCQGGRDLVVLQKAFPSDAVVSEQILLDVMKGLVICVHAYGFDNLVIA